jgi:xylan 1,4-beta-xylosidase
VGFRILHPRCTLKTRLEFSPQSYQQTAGLCLYYNTANFYYLYVTGAESGGRKLGLLACDNRSYREVLAEPIALPAAGGIRLGACVDGGTLRFGYGTDAAEALAPVGPELDATILSDDYPAETGLGLAFTGAFAALCAQDSSALNLPADFDWFKYEAASGGPSGESPPPCR